MRAWLSILNNLQKGISLKINNTFRLASLLKLVPVILIISSCTSIGPVNIGKDRMKYNEVLQQTNAQELLINLVRLRYFDTPSFVNIAGITAQSSLVTGASLSHTRSTSRAASKTLGLSNVFSPSISYSDAPVISYSPLQGDGFVRELLTPIPLSVMLLMSKSGWDIQKIFNFLIEKINSIPNAPRASGPTPETPPEYKEFQELLKNLKRMGNDVNLDYFGEKGKSQPGIRFAPGALQTPHGKKVAKQLKLVPGGNTFFLIDNVVLDRNDVIELQTRSLMGIMYFLSQSVTVPDIDLKAGLAITTTNTNGEAFNWSKITNNTFRVLVSLDRPENASVAVQYRGHWFYIANNDLHAKASFIMLSQLLALQSGNQELRAPALTLPLN